jgi:dTDP-4-amino-4,6-dideoxygalactose transaminase
MGKKVKEFEEKFAKNFGSKYATMVNSGSSANLLMLSVLKNYKKIIKKKNIINQILLHLLLDGVLHTIQYLKIILK